MNTREKVAADLYAFGRTAVRTGGNSLRSLAGHLVAMVNGNGEFEGPLWRVRSFPDRTVTLARFEDYLLRPSREGLGIPSLLWLRRVLEAHEDPAERAAALAAVRAEVADFDRRADSQQSAMDVREAVPLGDRGGDHGNQYVNKGINRQGSDRTLAPKVKRGENRAYLLARLKRDSDTDPKARGLLRRVAQGEVSARAAGLEMGYVKPVDAARVVDNHIKQMAPAELVALYRNLGRNLPEGVYDHLEAAKEAYLGLTDREAAEFMAWALSQGMATAA